MTSLKLMVGSVSAGMPTPVPEGALPRTAGKVWGETAVTMFRRTRGGSVAPPHLPVGAALVGGRVFRAAGIGCSAWRRSGSEHDVHLAECGVDECRPAGQT
jgi:hypothetical protein